VVVTTVSTGEIPTNLRDREDDDLTVVKGIGPARRRWLRESFNVRTFHDLAALSVDEIGSQLKAAGQITSRLEIAEWIAQAQELAASVNQSSQRDVGSTEAEAEEKANSPVREDDWKPVASFVVEFQVRQFEGQAEEQRTTVHHMEADRGETWPGIEGEQLCQWMLGQAGRKLQQEPEEGFPVETRPAAARAVTVEITQVQAFQPPQADTPIGTGRAGQPFSGFVRSGEPFALEASFGLAGPAAAEVAKTQVTYHAQLHAWNRSTGERTYLGDTKPDTLVEGKLSPYKAVLPEITLQQGMYHLRILTTLQGVRTAPGYLEVPLFQVV
jgi:hypothetical protein